MHTSILEQEPVIITQDMVAKATTAKTSRSITLTLSFLVGCVTLIMTGFAIIMPVFPQRLHTLGLGAETLALMEGAFGLGMFLFSTPMGTWAGRFGRKPILLLSLAGYVVTNLLLVVVNTAPLFVLIRFVEGMVISGLMPASMAMVGDSLAPSKQGRWIGWLTTAQATGIALGPAIGGLLSQTLGLTAPFILSAAIALVASLLAFLLVPETLPAHVRAESWTGHGTARISHLSGGHARPAHSGPGWTLDYSADHLHHRGRTLVGHGTGRLAPAQPPCTARAGMSIVPTSSSLIWESGNGTSEGGAPPSLVPLGPTRFISASTVT